MSIIKFKKFKIFKYEIAFSIGKTTPIAFVPYIGFFIKRHSSINPTISLGFINYQLIFTRISRKNKVLISDDNNKTKNIGSRFYVFFNKNIWNTPNFGINLEKKYIYFDLLFSSIAFQYNKNIKE